MKIIRNFLFCLYYQISINSNEGLPHQIIIIIIVSKTLITNFQLSSNICFNNAIIMLMSRHTLYIYNSFVLCICALASTLSLSHCNRAIYIWWWCPGYTIPTANSIYDYITRLEIPQRLMICSFLSTLWPPVISIIMVSVASLGPIEER